MRRGLVPLSCITAVLSCGQPAGVVSPRAHGRFAPNPLVAYIPADTPYAFATFEPAPRELYARMLDRSAPSIRHAIEVGEQKGWAADLLLEIVDAKHAEDLGFSASAHFVMYGLGLWPVLRLELASGDRVLALVERIAERAHVALPPPAMNARDRSWELPVADGLELEIVLMPDQAVVAVAPRDVITAHMPELLGRQPPAHALGAEALVAIAKRDGYGPYGVGFVDTVRATALAGEAAHLAPACTTALAGVARHAPRVTFGYDEVSMHRVQMAAVVELSADALDAVRGLEAPLAGFDRVETARPILALAAAFDIGRGRALLATVAGVLGDVGTQCAAHELAEAAESLDLLAKKPLPPFLDGVHGGVAVLDHVAFDASGPTEIEGYAVVRVDHADDVARRLTAGFPGLDVTADGQAHALPSITKFPGHDAVSTDAIAVAFGNNSADVAVGALRGKPVQAPLFYAAFDQARIGVLYNAEARADVDARKVDSWFGMSTSQLFVDDRGLVLQSSLEIK